MRHPRLALVTASLVGFLALVSSAALAQSYGLQEQILTIGAAEFQPLEAFDTYIDSDGYLYYSGDEVYLAPLSLPEGALVERICIWVNDSDPFTWVGAVLVAIKLVPGGESPGGRRSGSVISTSNGGYGYYCSEPVSYPVRGKADVDEDGSLDSLAHYVLANLPEATQNSLGLGAVQVFWKRKVSEPPSSPTFADVGPNDPAFAEIEALAASGITAGCAPGLYCPGANLTRRQMAVFLGKALGLQWAD